MKYDFFTELGLAKNEAKIYLALLKEKKSSARTLIENLGMHRVIIYDNLKKLCEKGFASTYQENNKKIYVAQDPEILKEHFLKEKEEIEEKIKRVEEKIPEIKKLIGEKERNETSIFTGIQGLKKALNLVRTSKEKEHYIIGSSESSEKILGITFWNNYFQKIIENKSHEKILINHNHKDNTIMSKKTRTEIRRLPKELSQKVEVIMFDKKVLCTVYTDKPTALLIDNEEMYKMFKLQFEFLWNQAQKDK